MKDILKAVVFGGLFLIPFLTLYVENSYFFPFITGKNFWFRIIVEVVFASWILLALYDRDYRPRWSWIFGSFSALVVVMFFANLFGEYPLKSFWSNFERMDGYVTIIHLFAFFMVLSSTLKEKKHWQYYLITSLVVAFFVSLYGLAQYAGVIEGRARIDSRLGNAAYLAIYMLFHIFIVLWLFVESRVTFHRVVYGLLSVMFIFTLLQTGTRGTTIGLAVGLTVTAAYIGLFGARFKEFRKYAIGIFAVLVLLGGGLFVLRDHEMVQGSPTLQRIANISIDDLTVRFTIWGMAVEGVKERPLLGWGQGNFNYVFNEQYDPSLYAQEQWFDRVHNIFFDWLIAGGILGFIAYFGIYFSALYYLFWRPLFNKDETFDVLERGVLVGLLAGYLTHNLVVFDNIISYIFYGIILAYIHARVGRIIPKVDRFYISDKLVSQFAAPIVLTIMVATVYMVNVPGMRAANDIIVAFRQSDPVERLRAFDAAINRNSFADQEIVEQLAQQAIGISNNQNISPEVRQGFVQRAELETLRMIEEKPGDARLHVFLASFYRSIGAVEQALEQATIARSLSPHKQSIIIQQAVLQFQLGDIAAARALVKEAFESAERNREARTFYAALSYYDGDGETGRKLIEDGGDTVMRDFAQNDFAVNAVEQAKDYEFLVKVFTKRVELRPNNIQDRASLAFVYTELEDSEQAIAVLNQAAEDLPQFAPTAQCFVANLEAGLPPEEGC